MILRASWWGVISVLSMIAASRSVMGQRISVDTVVCESAPVHLGKLFRSEKKSVLGIYVIFSDFGCVECLNNFLDMCDSIRSRSDSGRGRVVMFVRRDDGKISYQAMTLKLWALANGIGFRIYIISRGYFSLNGFKRSTALLLGEHSEEVGRWEIPLASEERDYILRGLFGGWGKK